MKKSLAISGVILLVVAASAFFASGQNPPQETAPATPSAATASAESRRGISVRPMSPSEARIEDALKSNVSCEFVDTPFHEAVEYFAKQSGIAIRLDQRVLNEAGFDPETRIELRMANVPLRTALEAILDELQLAWLIERDMLVVTTAEEAARRPLTRIYDVYDLVTRPDQPEIALKELETVKKFVLATSTYGVWEDWQGEGGAILTYNAPGFYVFVVMNTRRAHEEVEAGLALFRRLRRPAGAQPSSTWEKAAPADSPPQR